MWKDIFNPLTQDVHNTTLDIDENNYISFLVPYANVLLSSFASDNPGEGETAICTRNPWKCLILNGDHRKQYEELVVKGYEACYEYYQSNSHLKSSWSED